MAKILLVEDNVDLARAVADTLKSERYAVETAHDGGDGLEHLKLTKFDLVVLDWELPDMTGIDILKQYRLMGGDSPVLMLTGRSAIDDKETGLDSGADDYLTKPFDMRELLARLKALLRRRTVNTSPLLKVRNITLDPVKYKVTRDGAPVHLLPRDFALLEFFMRNPDEVFSVDTIIARVWEYDSEGSPEGLRVAIRRLRKALDNGDLTESIIENVARVGYRLRT